MLHRGAHAVVYYAQPLCSAVGTSCLIFVMRIISVYSVFSVFQIQPHSSEKNATRCGWLLTGFAADVGRFHPHGSQFLDLCG